jgi:D-alanyl-D-alanine carboxypeptidase
VRLGRRGAVLVPGALLVLTALVAGCSDGKPQADSGPTTSTSSSGSTSTTSPTPTTMPTKTPEPKATPKPAVTRLPAVPAGAVGPTVRFPAAPLAFGSGANATVTHIPTALWNRMVGYSWTSGCPVGRSSLRLVQVNYWGFDGIRHRGSVVVASAITSRTANAFTSLYALKFRIRMMRPMDSSWGHNPKGPGADDYAAMRADNTSGFNCRYVGGEESRKVWSNHAYGRAVDVNDFENPYVASNGTVYPSSYFLHRRTGPGTFTSSTSPAVRAFTRQGFSWGGTWSDPDFQHMDLG